MKEKLDYAVLAAHGSGINALNGFMNMQSDSSCLHHADEDKFNNFLASDNDRKKGVVIDSTLFEQNGLLERILNFPPELLIVLTRDPLARMKSVINSHIQWYANSATGFFEREVRDVLLWQHGGIANFINFMLPSHNMNTAATLFLKIRPFFKNIIFFDASAFAPDKVLETLNLIRKNLKLPEIIRIDGPSSLVFTKENTFVRDIRRLRFAIDDDVYYLKPYPFDHMPILQMNNEDVIITVEPEKVGFEVGKFAGPIGFVADGRQPTAAQKTAIRDLLNKYPHVVNRYCKDVSNRYKMAEKIANALFLDNEGALALCRENAETGRIVKEYFTRQFAVLFGLQNQPWTESREFLAKIETASF